MIYLFICLMIIPGFAVAAAAAITYLATVATGTAIAGLTIYETAFIYAAATYALTRLSEPKSAPSYGLPEQARTQVIRSSSSERKIAYGEVKINGLLAYLHVDSSNYLHIVLVWAHQTSEEVVGLYVNDDYVPTPSSGNAVTQGKYANVLEMYHHLGEQTTADSVLVSRVSEWTDAHKLMGQTYSYIRVRKNASIFPYGIPSISAVLKGKKVVDPRLSLTNSTIAAFRNVRFISENSEGYQVYRGSNGLDVLELRQHNNENDIILLEFATTQKVAVLRSVFVSIEGQDITNLAYSTVEAEDTPQYDWICTSSEISSAMLAANTTHTIRVTADILRVGQSLALPVYTDNPILCAADYIKSDYGLNTDNMRDFIFAANICDELITSTGADGLAFNEKRYGMAATIGLNESKLAVLDKIRQACAGNFYYSGGEWVLDVGRIKTPETRNITEDDLTKEISLSTNVGNRDLFNTITPKLIDRGDNWRATTAPNVKILSAISLDRRKIVKVIDYSYVRTATRALALSSIALLKHRQKRALTVTGKLALLQYELGDIVSVNLTNLAISSIEWEIADISMSGLEVTLGLHEYAAKVYADSPDVQFSESPSLTYTNRVEFTTVGTHTWTVPNNALGNKFRIYIASGKGGDVIVNDTSGFNADTDYDCDMLVTTYNGGSHGWSNSIEVLTSNNATIIIGGSGFNHSLGCIGTPRNEAETGSNGDSSSITCGGVNIFVPGGETAASPYFTYTDYNTDDQIVTQYAGVNGDESDLRAGNDKGTSQVIIEWNN